MSRVIKDTSLFAVYDPDSGRENLYQFSALQLFDDISFTIENELTDYLSVEVLPPSLAFRGGNLALSDNTFFFTPASIPDNYAESEIIVINNYVDYLGAVVVPENTGTQEEVNQYYTPIVNTNEKYRRALSVDPTTEFGITYDDNDDPTRIDSIRADHFHANDHGEPTILSGVRDGTDSQVTTLHDLYVIRDDVNFKFNIQEDNVRSIVEYIRANESLNRGGMYLTQADPTLYTDVNDTSAGLIPTRVTISEIDPNGDTVEHTSQLLLCLGLMEKVILLTPLLPGLGFTSMFGETKTRTVMILKLYMITAGTLQVVTL